VAEAVKRYSFPVLAILFVNNSLKPRESKLIMQSFQHHIATIINLNLSMNNLSLSGAEYLASVIPNMRSVKNLNLNDCHLSDRGVKAIVENLDTTTSLDILDLSANQIGQSSYFKESAAALTAYIIKQT
jgi:Ran GTPase-activating protein (RanGAP) involved in mRNA processing and transport